ncbi:MAG TPA: sensor histidine kinase [Chryseosolibacter sp.]|nr:sensor histidine kinase [Chryseosolibacter sp.]
MFPHVGLKIVGVFLFLIITWSSAYGQDPFILDAASSVYRLDTVVSVYLDDTHQLTIDDVSAPNFQSRFEQRKENLTFGYIDPTLWLKVELQNGDARSWLLEIPAPFLERVEFYQIADNNKPVYGVSGYYVSFDERNTKNTGHVLPLTFGTDRTTTVYIKITGLSPKTFPMFAIEKETYLGQTRWEDLGYGVFFGILAVMFFYNLFIFLSLRQTNYLLYICTIVCTFFIFASASGYAGKFLWPQHPHLNYYAGRLSLPVLTIFLSIFTIRFLEVKEYSRAMYYALLALIPLSVIALVLITTTALSSAGNNLVALSTFIYIATGIICRIRGNNTANYFIAAWTIYITGGLLLTLRNAGIFDFDPVTTHFVEVGAALETIIIAFALGDRYRKLKQEKEAAQMHALKLQLGANEKLELKVKERTEELSRANQELEDMLQKNRIQTKIIENKNAELDSFFYRISHDLKGPISSLLGLSSLAKLEITDANARLYFEKQLQQIERLDHVISGLIKLTRLNHTDNQKESIDFGKLIADCISSFSGMKNFGEITFRTDIQPGITFHCEWALLNAIIQNLIENSIKYARSEKPFVHVRITKNSVHQVMIEVADNGVGIPADHQSRIFEMFFRATHNATGSGLGLYILKRSVDRLDGTIDIKSEEGVGSTFTIRLPATSLASTTAH